jgi:DNA-3-methyladenine glycosylase I
MISRCPWGMTPEIYCQYHDQEWGVPLHQEQKLFEFLTLEAFQAGLSWLTVLKKRENFRRAFAAFDPARVGRFSAAKIAKLLTDASIIRNRAKIEATVANARAFLQVQEEQGSFDQYIWSFVERRPIVNHWRTLEELPASTPLAQKLARDLKSRGFRFLGPTVVYAHMQATGMVNDHLVSCFRHRELASRIDNP